MEKDDRGFFGRTLDMVVSGLAEFVTKAATPIPTYMVVQPGSDRPVFTDWDTATGIQRGMKASSWVYACTRIISWEASSVPWVLQERNAAQSNEWSHLPDHPLTETLEHPGPLMTRQMLIQRTSQHLYMGGNSIWHKVRAGQPIKGIQAAAGLDVFQPDQCKPIPDEVVTIRGYRYTPKSGRGGETLPVQDIVHFQFPDPDNLIWGMSPLRALGQILDAELDAIGWIKTALQNRLVKDGLLAYKRRLNKPQWQEARDQIQAQMGPSAPRGPLILGDDATYTPFTMSPQEFDFLNSRKMTCAEILAVFGVPPPLVGLIEQATYANIKEARRILWLDTVIPLLDIIAGELNRCLVPEFEDPQTHRLVYDLSNVDALQRDLGEKVVIGKNLWSMGVPFNQINRRLELGLDDIPGGDVGYVPNNFLPIGSAPPEPAKPALPSPTSNGNGKPVGVPPKHGLPEFGVGLPEPAFYRTSLPPWETIPLFRPKN